MDRDSILRERTIALVSSFCGDTAIAEIPKNLEDIALQVKASGGSIHDFIFAVIPENSQVKNEIEELTKRQFAKGQKWESKAVNFLMLWLAWSEFTSNGPCAKLQNESIILSDQLS